LPDLGCNSAKEGDKRQSFLTFVGGGLHRFKLHTDMMGSPIHQYWISKFVIDLYRHISVFSTCKEIHMNMRNCIAGGLVALMLSVSACAATPPDRSTGQVVDDSALAVKAKSALIENPETKAYKHGS